MLELDNRKWSELQHAYGAATDIPALLRQLADTSAPEDDTADPYASLRRLLLRRDRAYPASYAVVPHLVAMLESKPTLARCLPLQLIVRIEVARAKGNGPEPGPALAADYLAALERLPAVLATMAMPEWNEKFARAAAAALAAVKRQPALAEAILALTPDRIPDFMDTVADDE